MPAPKSQSSGTHGASGSRSSSRSSASKHSRKGGGRGSANGDKDGVAGLAEQSADRVRRTVGVGQTFPILAYDDLTAAQVQVRLDGLSPGELRRVREYERRHANRKSVLVAIDKALAPR